MNYPKAARLQKVGEYYFSKKAAEIRRLEANGPRVINLGIGSPDLAPEEGVIAAASTALSDRRNHAYAPYRSLPELRNAIASWYGDVYGIRPDPETRVLPLLGSKEGIFYVSLAFLDPGDKVLVPDPGYPAYAAAARLAGAEPVAYGLSESGGWLPDLEALERLDLADCRLMWVNYPHMPTGAPATRELFDRLAAFGRKKGILICSDNPYSLILNGGNPLSILGSDPEGETSLELNSLSKSFNMAGWRVGMLLGAPETVEAVLQVKSNADSGMFLPVQAGAVKALSLPAGWHAARNAVYGKRRSLVRALFDALGFSYTMDQAGLFVWAKAPDRTASVEEFLDRLLREARVFITPGSVFGRNGARYARASLCADEGVIAEALERVRRRGAGL